ncbi:uncharacterized protein LOC115337892 isoform X1 [Aquila chrysaetos chrysaetos]|uniref:uncharacterized protein LOC115337892 isoform X1 n=1 Tax=Aquila chrysaetos chrysaetos TaxID=223781 RepID=UPI001B7D3D7B|nr:uncharacterized protein LOC115337892 isoform X1 [Aquila chrysaetos chrysaetos]
MVRLKFKFKNGEIKILIPETKHIEAVALLLQDGYRKQRIIPVEVNNAVIPIVWAEEVPGKSKRAEPVRIDLKPGSSLLRQKMVYPAVFLTTDQLEGELEHGCLQTIEEVCSSQPDLRGAPLEEKDWELYTDGSSFIREGKRLSGYAVTTTEKVTESRALPSDVSAQKAELVALTRALELRQGKRISIWRDSKYAFGVVHAHGAIWKERGLLPARGTTIQHAEQILKLLEAIQKPTAVAIMHCKAHQSGRTVLETGNGLADRAAKEAAEKGILALVPEKSVNLPKDAPNYNEKDEELIIKLQASKNETGWAVTPTGQIIVPPAIMREIARAENNKVR